MKKIICLLATALLFGCAAKTEITVAQQNFGKLTTGESVEQYSLITPKIRVKAITYGGIITNIEVPDKNGKWQDVVLGYDKLADYELKNRFFGALVGRFANRIENGLAEIDGKKVQLSINKAPNQSHGGNKGFDKLIWQATPEQTPNAAKLHLTLTSPDGAEGFPGELIMKVTYSATTNGELIVEYAATSDKTTILNPTQHSYFNLSGSEQSDVLAHKLQINALQTIELKPDSLPTGRLINVKNSALDFLEPKEIAEAINSNNPQIKLAKGLDHYFVQKQKRGELTEFAHLFDENSGRSLIVSTTEQGGQIYSANYLDGSVIGKNGTAYRPQQGICIETGQFTNAPAQPEFKTYLLKPEQPYYSKTIFSFSAE